VMQLYYIDAETGEIVNKPVKHVAFLEHFANRSPCLIGMEACGGSQHWARKLSAMGHQLKLMPGRFVKACVMGKKNDAADARAIWAAVQQPGKSVAVKTKTQPAVLGLHRMREYCATPPSRRRRCSMSFDDALSIRTAKATALARRMPAGLAVRDSEDIAVRGVA
jgi:hypothetical protein